MRRPEMVSADDRREAPESLVNRWMQLDRNRDQKLTRDELPPERRVYFPDVDTNKDDECRRDELLETAKRLAG